MGMVVTSLVLQQQYAGERVMSGEDWQLVIVWRRFQKPSRAQLHVLQGPLKVL